MAFDQVNFAHVGYGNGFSIWNYQTDDTAAGCLVDGYFTLAPLVLLRVGDTIHATCSDGNIILTVATNDGSTVTVSSPGIKHEPVFGDYLTSGFALGKGANAPTLTELRDGIFLNAFAGTGPTTEEGFFIVHLLHDLKAGTDLTFHAHWTHNNASPSGSVKWQIDYTVAKGYSIDTYGAPVSLSTTQAAGVQYTHHITPDDDMTVATSADIEPDSAVLARVYRNPADAADTFEDLAFLVTIDMHYVKGQIGTTERNRPFTSAGFGA